MRKIFIKINISQYAKFVYYFEKFAYLGRLKYCSISVVIIPSGPKAPQFFARTQGRNKLALTTITRVTNRSFPAIK